MPLLARLKPCPSHAAYLLRFPKPLTSCAFPSSSPLALRNSLQKFRLDPNCVPLPESFVHGRTLANVKFDIPVLVEAINLKATTDTKPEQLRGSHLSTVRILQILVRIPQIRRNLDDPSFVAYFEGSLMARGAALASSPTVTSLGRFLTSCLRRPRTRRR